MYLDFGHNQHTGISENEYETGGNFTSWELIFTICHVLLPFDCILSGYHFSLL